jgi:hypothetical protein
MVRVHEDFGGSEEGMCDKEKGKEDGEGLYIGAARSVRR